MSLKGAGARCWKLAWSHWLWGEKESCCHFSQPVVTILEETRGCRETVLKSTCGWIPSRTRKGVPVNYKECCWQETLRSLKRALNGNMRAREETLSAENVLAKKVCPRYRHPEGEGLQNHRKSRERGSGQPSKSPGWVRGRKWTAQLSAGVWEEATELWWGRQRCYTKKTGFNTKRDRQGRFSACSSGVANSYPLGVTCFYG